jgi:glycosyltransferase involved in cell wall biosynthesis
VTRVLLDATAVPADRGGVGRYLDGLVAGLDAAGADLVLVCQPADAAHLAGLAPTAEIVAAPAPVARRPARLAWEQSGLPALARRVDADVLHCPHYTMPLAPGRPVVVTVHDLTFFTDPDLHGALKGRFFRAATRHAARRATRVVTPSDATRHEMVRLLAADPTRIDVAHHGVDTAVFHPPAAAEIAHAAAEFGSYVAFLGTLEPRKNLAALVRGWVRAVAAELDPPALVLAGGRGWDGELDAAVAAVPAGLTVLRPGYLPLEQLRGYLGGALLVAYPALGEGFGLPVLEAMACGAAVLTTRRLALPEVGGDAVAYTEVDDRAIEAALRALLADPDRRDALGAAGIRRAATFTWEACALAHLEAYERAAA